jgi:hypothetical protein
VFVREGLELAIQDGCDLRARIGGVSRSRLLRRAWRPAGRTPGKIRRSLDPQHVAQLESALWMSYYRREWTRFLRVALAVMRDVFGLPWASTARGSWFLLRATRLWSPDPDNDPPAARVAMERFYRVLKQHTEGPFDPAEVARLEVEWWRIHRVHQHTNASSDGRALVDALAALYAYAFDVPETTVRRAAEQRALAMRFCDQWVRAGCDPESSLVSQKREALVRSYASLVAAVQRA